jgi:O-antigen/teichoic acid export membrane protein
MKTYIRKILSDTVIYGVGNVLNRFIGILLLPVYTHYFTPAEFGIYSLVFAFWFFAVVFYLFGMETAFQKFYLEAKSEDEKKKIFSTTILMMLGSSVLLSIIIFLFSGFISKIVTGNSGNAYLFRLLSVILLIDSLTRFPMILINSEQWSKVYSFINISAVILNVLCNVVFIAGLHYGIESIFYSFLISYSYTAFVSLFICRKYFIFILDSTLIQPLVKYGHLFLYYGIFLISLDLIDRFLLGYLKDDDTVGIYSACYRIGLVMNLAVSGFRNAWFPFFMKLKDEKENRKIFAKVFSYFCYACFAVFLVISFFVSDIVKINIGGFTFLNERYFEGLKIVPFIMLSYFFFGLYINILVASFFENKISYLLISSGIGCISNIIFNLILIPEFSFMGAAVATMLSYALMFLILYLFSQRIYHINYEWRRIGIIFLLTIFLYILNIFVLNISFLNNETLNYLVKFVSVLIIPSVLFGFKFLKWNALKNTP